MGTPSVTPKPERRNCVRSFSQPLAAGGEIALGGAKNNIDDSMDLPGRHPAASVYHQICSTGQMSSNGRGWTMNARIDNSSRNGHHRMVVEECTDDEHSLLYKMQLLQCIEVATKRLLFHMVKACASMPNLFRLLPFILFAFTILFCGFFNPYLSFMFPSGLFQMSENDDTTTGGGCWFARISRESGRNEFAEDNPTFDALEMSSPSEFAILFSTKDRYDSVLPPANRTSAAFVELFRRIQQITVAQHKHIYKWYDVCRQCRLDAVVGHLLKNDLDWTFPEAQLRFGNWTDQGATSLVAELDNATGDEKRKKTIFVAGTIGDVDLSSSDGNFMRRAHSLLMKIKLKPQLKFPVLAAFERRLRQIVSNWTPPNGEGPLMVHYWSTQRWFEEVESALRSIHFKMLASFALLAVILTLAETRQSAYETRPLLGLQIYLVLLLATASLYAVHVAGTGRLNPLLFPLPYFLMSIGVLSFCTINSALDRYSGIAMHPTEKMAFVFIWDGPCLVLSLIFFILLCPLIAIFVDTPLIVQSILSFSVGLVSLLLFTLFLAVCWLNYSQRVAAGLKWFHFWRKGDCTFNEKQMFDYDAQTCARLHEKLADLRPNFSRRLGALTCNHNFRMVSFALFVVGCFAAIVWSRPRVQLDMAQFVPRGGSSEFIERFHVAFPKYENYLELDFDGLLDYEESKEQIFTLLKWSLESGFATKVTSWLAEFDKFRKGMDLRPDDDSMLPLLTHLFLPSEQFRKFATDVRITQGQIHRSRMYLELSDEGRENSESFMRELLSRARQMGLPLVLKAPFSFAPGHDLQVLWRIFGALFTLTLFSALLNVLQPSTALCLFLTNVFLCSAANAIAHRLHIPLNIITLGMTLPFGVMFNSVSVLHFAYHFFNAGLRQTRRKERVEYAFQCTLWPLLLASVVGPVCFSVQLVVGQPAPIVYHVWRMICICSFLTFAQIVTFVPGLLILTSDYFHTLFNYANQLCDENANAELTFDPMAENVYFVPSYNRRSSNTLVGMPYGPNSCPIEQFTFRPLCVPPSYQPPSIDFRKNFAQHAIQHNRQQSQLSQRNSPRPGSDQRTTPLPIYSPPNKRKTDEGVAPVGGSRSESLESRADIRLQRRISKPPRICQRQEPSPVFRPIPRNNGVGEEQIYEEPETPELMRRDRLGKQYKSPNGFASPKQKRKF